MAARVDGAGRLLRAAVMSAVAALWGLTGCQSVAVPEAPTPSAPTRDASGLVLMPPESAAVLPSAIPADLDPAFAVVSRLSWDNPDDFSRPTVEDGWAVLTVTSTQSAPIAAAADVDAREAALLAYDADVRLHFPKHPSPPDLLSKRLVLTPERLELVRERVQVETGTMSITAIDALVNGAFDFASTPRFRAADVWGASWDEPTGLAVVSMATLTPELAEALVTKYGTDRVSVQVGQKPLTSAS